MAILSFARLSVAICSVPRCRTGHQCYKTVGGKMHRRNHRNKLDATLSIILTLHRFWVVVFSTKTCANVPNQSWEAAGLHKIHAMKGSDF